MQQQIPLPYITLRNTSTLHVPSLRTDELILFLSHISQQMLNISSTCINTRIYVSDHALLRPFTAPVQVDNGATNMKDKLVKCRFIFKSS